MDLLYRMIVGTLVGFLLGQGLAYILFRKSAEKDVLEMNNGFIALAATLVIYAFTEMTHAYGLRCAILR